MARATWSVSPAAAASYGPHDALDAGELHHGVGDQVGLRQERGTGGVAGIVLAKGSVGGQMGGQRHDAVGLVARGAQRLLEHDLVEVLHVAFQGSLEVFLVEELSIRQPRTHYALVAVDDGVGAGGVAVADQDKGIGQLALVIVEREMVALVRYGHGVDDDLLGDGQELLVEDALREASGTRRGW